MAKNPLKALDAARTASSRAHDKYWQAFRAAFPVGAWISWDHNGHRQDGCVESLGAHYGGTDPYLCARNSRTGAIVNVSDYKITGKYE